MKLRRENTSTDRLLEIIRGKKQSQQDATSPDAASAGKAASSESDGKAAKKTRSRSSFSLGKAKSAKGGGRKTKGPAKGFKPSLGSSHASKVMNVGVDIGSDCLRMVKMKGPESKRKLVDLKRVPFDPQVMPTDSPAFRDFLRSELKSMCGKPGSCEIWSLIPSGKVDIWHLRIPIVPKKQIPDAVYWAVKKEKQFDETEFLLDFEVQGVVEEKNSKRLKIMAYLVPRNEMSQVQKLFADTGYKLTGLTISPLALQALFRSNWTAPDAESYACLYVGRDWSRIDIFENGNLVLNRGIKTGTNSMVEALMNNYNEQARRSQPQGEPQKSLLADEEPVISLSLEDDDDAVHMPEISLSDSGSEGQAPAAASSQASPDSSNETDPSITLDLEIEDDEDPSDAPSDKRLSGATIPELTFGGDEDAPTQTWTIGEDDTSVEIVTDSEAPRPSAETMNPDIAKTVFFNKLLNKDVDPGLPGANLTASQIFDLVLPAAGRLVRQIERTFDYHTTTQGNQRVESIYLSGRICTSPQLIQYFDGQLGTATNLLDPLSPDNPTLKGETTALPESNAERLDFNLTLALALCDNATTPNILYTYAAREKDRQNSRVNQMIYMGFIFVALALAGVYLWQNSIIDEKKRNLAQLDSKLAQYNPRVDQALLMNMAGKIVQQRQNLKQAGQRYESLALIREISTLTPDFIQLVKVTFHFADYQLEQSKEGDKKAKSPQNAATKETMELEGVILGNTKLYDPALTNYLIKLENSPLLAMPAIQESAVEDFHTQGKVLRFSLKIPLEQ